MSNDVKPKDKAEGSGSQKTAKSEREPFERLVDLTRRIVAVPREKIEERERAYRNERS